MEPTVQSIIVGAALIILALFTFLGAVMKSNFILYRCYAARAALCVGEENKHKMVMVQAGLTMLFGVLLAIGVIPLTKK